MKNVIAGLEEGLGAIATALEGDGYPKPTNVPQGKVLTADGDDGASWENAPSGLPSTSGKNLNDVLIIGDTTTTPPTADWYSLQTVLPNMDANHYANNGEVITYNSSTGKAEWQTHSGGGLPSITPNDNYKVLTAHYDDKSGTSEVGWDTITNRVGYVFLDKSEFTYDDKMNYYYINYGATDKYVLSVVATENYGDGKHKVISEYSIDSHYSMLYIDGTTFTALSDYAYIALYYMI